MKKILIGLGIIIVSLIITFGVFYTMSWYSFSTLPTKVILYRMIFFFIAILILLIGIIMLIKKFKNRKFDKQQYKLQFIDRNGQQQMFVFLIKNLLENN